LFIKRRTTITTTTTTLLLGYSADMDIGPVFVTQPNPIHHSLNPTQSNPSMKTFRYTSSQL